MSKEKFWSPLIILIKVGATPLKFAQIGYKELLPAKRGSFVAQDD